MAHKKFIENPLGLRWSKKESLLIPLQEQGERRSACLLCDLYDSTNRGHGGEDVTPTLCPRNDLHATSYGLPSWLFLDSSFFQLGCQGDLDDSPQFRQPWSLLLCRLQVQKGLLKEKGNQDHLFPFSAALVCVFNEPHFPIGAPSLVFSLAPWSSRSCGSEAGTMENRSLDLSATSSSVTAMEMVFWVVPVLSALGRKSFIQTVPFTTVSKYCLKMTCVHMTSYWL